MENTKKVIALYGPPGVGKLTIAKEIAEKTGFKVLHSHMISDLLSEFFETGTKELTENFKDLWFFLFERLLQEEKLSGIVITLVYGVQTLEGKNDDEFFSKIEKKGKEYGAKVMFVKLKCSKEELHRRISSSSRKKYKKMTDFSVLEEMRKKYKVDDNIPFTESIIIDTTDFTSRISAEEIIKKCDGFMSSC